MTSLKDALATLIQFLLGRCSPHQTESCLLLYLRDTGIHRHRDSPCRLEIPNRLREYEQ